MRDVAPLITVSLQTIGCLIDGAPGETDKGQLVGVNGVNGDSSTTPNCGYYSV